MRRRPDVREAEARLHETTAQTGIAVASFYPALSLTGSFTLNGLRFSNAFSLPSRMFDIGPTRSIPVFRGGRLTGQLRLRESQQREAALAFERTVLQAWREVEDALTAYVEAQRRRVNTAETAGTPPRWPPPGSVTRRASPASSTSSPPKRNCCDRKPTSPIVTSRSRPPSSRCTGPWAAGGGLPMTRWRGVVRSGKAVVAPAVPVGHDTRRDDGPI